MKIGFLGLGIMGRPMALNLLRHGTDLLIDRSSSKAAELIAAGASPSDLQEIGRVCDIVFTMLPSGSIVKDVLLGEGGVVTAIRSGTIVCDLSSISPVEAKEIGAALAERGVLFYDAPVSGSDIKATDGTLSIMAGGDEAHFDVLKPYLLRMGSSAVLVGGIGAGSVAKLANQIIVNATIAAVAEGLTLARNAGADPAKVLEAIRGGLAGSTVLEQKAPKMLERDFAPGGKLSIIRKDLSNIRKTALVYDSPLELTPAVSAIVDQLIENGYADEDQAAMIRYYE